MPIVTCPACAAEYDVPMNALGGAGRKLRCAQCKNLFLSAPPEEAAADCEPEGVEADPVVAEQTAPPEFMTPPDRNAHATEHLHAAAHQPARKVPWHMRIGATPARPPAGAAPLVVLVGVLAAVAAGIGLRRTIVRTVPESAALYAAIGLPVNLRGLELREVKSGVFNEANAEVLVVQGEIVNITGREQSVPPLAFTVRNEKGTGVYSWTASADATVLAPGAKVTFRRRLASPPAEGTDVLVRFAGGPARLALAH